jgi:aspartyl-tRNA(Asn)/glutamyl-tRNA(Gln) amidotransferase subunit B
VGQYEPVIGLEVHCQLATRSKLFCGCSTQFGAAPNQNTCPVCLGLPGVLPVLNEEVLRFSLRIGIALGCAIRNKSQFARKNYFYPDLPKGYQISQYDKPILEGGTVTIDTANGVRAIQLTRIHIEEDAGKTIHVDGVNESHVDLNRAGVPLIEIVSEPELRSADEAVTYLKEIHNIVRYLGICDGHMEQGSFRCDANVSIRPVGETTLGTRTELKNINSFNHVKRAIEYEISRQEGVIESGGAVIQETRLWDDRASLTRSMRSKEEAHDYRYFPEPDLHPIVIRAALENEVKSNLPELPRARRERYQLSFGLSDYDAVGLTSDKDLSDFFEVVVRDGCDPKTTANWVQTELVGRLNAAGRSIVDSPISPQELAVILKRLGSGKISGKQTKDVFHRVFDGVAVETALSEVGEQLTDTSAIEAVVKTILDGNAVQVESYLNGKTKLLGFFVGQVMKETKGAASPAVVNTVLKQMLEDRRS